MFKRKVEEPEESEEPLSPEEFEKAKCSHCGGVHLRACPRVKMMKFGSGSSLEVVEFWETWDESFTVWPEDVYRDRE